MPVARTRKLDKTPAELQDEGKAIYRRARLAGMDRKELKQLVRAASQRTGGRRTLMEQTANKRAVRVNEIEELIKGQRAAHRTLHRFVGEPVAKDCNPCGSTRAKLVTHWQGCQALEAALRLARVINAKSGRALQRNATSATRLRGQALSELYEFGRPMTLTWREVAMACLHMQNEVLTSDRVALEMNAIRSATKSAKRKG